MRLKLCGLGNLYGLTMFKGRFHCCHDMEYVVWCIFYLFVPWLWYQLEVIFCTKLCVWNFNNATRKVIELCLPTTVTRSKSKFWSPSSQSLSSKNITSALLNATLAQPIIIMQNGTDLGGAAVLVNDTLLANGTVTLNHTTTFHSSHATQQHAVIRLGYLFAAICFFMVLLRTLIRPLNHERYKIDDFVMIGSMFLLAALTATNPLIVSMEISLWKGQSLRIDWQFDLQISHGNNVDIGFHLILNFEQLGRGRFKVSSIFGILLKSCSHDRLKTFACRTFLILDLPLGYEGLHGWWLYLDSDTSLMRPQLMYYRQLTTYTKEIWIIRGTGFILAVTWLICILTYFLECHPLELFWKVLLEPPECAVSSLSSSP